MRNPESSKAWIPAPRFRGDKLTPAKAGAGMTNQRIGFGWLCFFAASVYKNLHKPLLLLLLRQLALRKIGFVLHDSLIATKALRLRGTKHALSQFEPLMLNSVEQPEKGPS